MNAVNHIALKSTGSHLNTNAASDDLAGTISISATTSNFHTFGVAFGSTPVCVLTPTSNPGALTWWVSATTSAVTAHLSASGTITFNYHCVGAPN